jgi:hypothetical protein
MANVRRFTWEGEEWKVRRTGPLRAEDGRSKIFRLRFERNGRPPRLNAWTNVQDFESMTAEELGRSLEEAWRNKFPGILEGLPPEAKLPVLQRQYEHFGEAGVRDVLRNASSADLGHILEDLPTDRWDAEARNSLRELPVWFAAMVILGLLTYLQLNYTIVVVAVLGGCAVFTVMWLGGESLILSAARGLIAGAAALGVFAAFAAAISVILWIVAVGC